jgi:GMP synthase (glutamine-hydrolysing)
MKTAVAIRHVHFEHLGTFDTPLAEAGYSIEYHDIGVDPWNQDALARADLLIVLGGPIGVYETDAYPFLADEVAVVRRRLDAGAPTLGICLGAQIMAAALGARVAPTGTKEIGFATVDLTEAGQNSPLRHLNGVAVLHWHGDMFEIPEGAQRLASTPICANQAFAIGSTALGLQFHLEVDATIGFERWLIGHALEISSAGLNPADLRRDSRTRAETMTAASKQMLSEWLIRF